MHTADDLRIYATCVLSVRTYMLMHCARDSTAKNGSNRFTPSLEVVCDLDGSNSSSLAEGVKQCERDHTALNQFEPVPFAQYGQALTCSVCIHTPIGNAVHTQVDAYHIA